MVSPRRCTVVLLAVLGTWVAASPRAHAGPAVTEYQLKAVFLLNFARFVTWPPEAFAAPDAPLVVCVLGTDPFGSVLDEALANERIGDRPLAARRVASADATDGCQMLFVAERDARAHAALLQTLGVRPVLTVGDEGAFARNGGMVGFEIEEGTVRISVNPDALRTAGLTMSSQILRMARIVGGPS
jgi:hypothetical protein